MLSLAATAASFCLARLPLLPLSDDPGVAGSAAGSAGWGLRGSAAEMTGELLDVELGDTTLSDELDVTKPLSFFKVAVAELQVDELTVKL